MAKPRFKVAGTLGDVHIETDYAFQTAYGAKQWVIEQGVDPYNIIDGQQ